MVLRVHRFLMAARFAHLLGPKMGGGFHPHFEFLICYQPLVRKIYSNFQELSYFILANFLIY